MNLAETERKCAVVGCDEPAEKLVDRRFIPALQAMKLRVRAPGRKVPLCRKHYKMAKEAMKGLMGVV